ncbi:MAG: PilZ domain-containing protein [Acidobacteria bacterium]|nr:PilZ domain-containing protein [Acidobacteriota bacterium]
MPELRRSARVSLMEPVSLRITNNGHHALYATTRDLSAGGVFLYADKEISAGTPVEIDLDWPQDFSCPERVQLRGWGRVVRVEAGAFPGTFGVALAIAGYQLREWPAQAVGESREEVLVAGAS